MKQILILMGRYLPGHKDGGPLRTIANVTEALGDEYDFHIACLDRDHGDTEPYPGIRMGEWNRVGKAKVWYMAPGGFTDELILQLSKGMDLIYLSSFFDDYGYKTLWLRRRGKITIPVALASMGVFSEAALKRKALKKKLFIGLCKAAGMFRGITWSVTSELEAADLKRVIGADASCIIAEDLPRSRVPGSPARGYEPPLRLVFLSRICEHKGLLLAIEAIKQSGVSCFFTVCGPVQEPDYWRECQRRLQGLPWEYRGDIPSDEVQHELSRHDVLILPTKSENYGHVIFEALSVGCIPIISDTTPWHAVQEYNAGIVTGPDARQLAEALRQLNDLPRERLAEMASNGVQLARDKIRAAQTSTGYRDIFGKGGNT
ncbi:MAG: glycosyltransferase family 4 protein [Oscillospiraceae bacterium]|nr:glycosyltransferase family 4 protein [Oscillospiraceae bacterium]